MLRIFRRKSHSVDPSGRLHAAPIEPLSWPLKTWLRLFVHPFAAKVFFEGLIRLLAFIAHADGSVTERELLLFMEFLSREFRLSRRQARRARGILFKVHTEGRSFEEIIKEFALYFKDSRAALENAFDVMLAMAFEDNRLRFSEQKLLAVAAKEFGINDGDYQRLQKRYLRPTTIIESEEGPQPKSERESQHQRHQWQGNNSGSANRSSQADTQRTTTKSGFSSTSGHSHSSASSNRKTSTSESRSNQRGAGRASTSSTGSGSGHGFNNGTYRDDSSSDNKNAGSNKRARQVFDERWWVTLGVSASATRKEVRRAYSTLAMTYHPDKQPPGIPDAMKRASLARFIEVHNAYKSFEALTGNKK